MLFGLERRLDMTDLVPYHAMQQRPAWQRAHAADEHLQQAKTIGG